ncbi:MAG: hypothetical protein KF745_12695 [Phycisphaeraceae bacterium]|nr:hypothetical protein [Phycisphaeraceae bacterium]
MKRRGVRRPPAEEGTVVAVPLPSSGGYGIAVVSRWATKVLYGSRRILGYGFGPRLPELPLAVEIGRLDPRHANIVLVTYDDEIASGSWKIVGKVQEFSRGEWPMPRFSYYHDTLRRWLEIRHVEDTLDEEFGERNTITIEDARSCADYGFNTPGAFAGKLDRAICEGWQGRPPVMLSQGR